MISTLFVEEFRITRKALLATGGITIFVAVASFAVAMLKLPVISGIGFVLGLIALVIILPAALFILAESYWRTMYGREGYLTMTLPARGRTLFTAKVLYGIVATLVAALVTVLGSALAFAVSVSLQGQSVTAAFEGVWASLGQLDPALIWFVIACIVLQLVFTVISGAAIMSIGAEARFNHLGFGAPVLGAILLYVFMQVAGLAAMLFVPFGLKVTGPDGGTLVAQGMWSDFSAAITGSVPSGSDPSVIGLGIVFVSVIVAVLLAWRGGRSVERHTSLR